MNNTLQTPQDRLEAAGEYVLGTLSPADQEAFAADLAKSHALRAMVYEWQDRLLGLSRHVAPESPGAALWPRIESNVGALASPASNRRSRPEVTRWWQRAGLWQGFSLAATVAALWMASILVIHPMPSGDVTAGARFVAMLQSPTDQSTGWVVEVQAGRAVRLVPVGDPAPVPPGRVLQFWTKPQGAAGPTSLGLVKQGQALDLPVSQLPGLGEQQLFEITLEPEGGSPTGRPTGPIQYVGRTVRL